MSEPTAYFCALCLVKMQQYEWSRLERMFQCPKCYRRTIIPMCPARPEDYTWFRRRR